MATRLLMMLTSMAIVSLVALAPAQTVIAPTQFSCPGPPASGVMVPAVMMTVPTGPSAIVTMCVPLHPSLQLVGGRLMAVQQFPTVTDVFSEVPAGVIDGANKVFTLKAAPTLGTLRLYRNGLRQKEIVDCSLSGDTITFVNAPEAGSVLLADYRK